MKKMYPYDQINTFITDIMPKIEFPIDGLIFTPVDVPIETGTQYSLFKWKKQFDNTVDFQIKKTDKYLILDLIDNFL